MVNVKTGFGSGLYYYRTKLGGGHFEQFFPSVVSIEQFFADFIHPRSTKDRKIVKRRKKIYRKAKMKK